MPKETRYWVCRWHNLRRNEKTMTGKTVQGRAVYLIFGFYAQVPTKSPVMPILDADEVPATRKLIPTARELVSPQRHRCVIAQKVVHSFVPDCTFQLRPPTQCVGLVYTNRKDVGACSLVADVLTIVKMYVCAARCKDGCLAPRTHWVVNYSH